MDAAERRGHDAGDFISLRTVQRRVHSGAYETRRGVIGRREVRLETLPTEQENMHEAIETIQSQGSLLQQAHEAELTRLRREFWRWERASRRRFALTVALAAVLAVAAVAAAWGEPRVVGKSEAELLSVQLDSAMAALRSERDKFAQLQQGGAVLTVERDRLRQDRDRLVVTCGDLQQDLRNSQGEVGRLEVALETFRRASRTAAQIQTDPWTKK